MELKQTITTKKEVETEIELPYYFKLKYTHIGDTYFAILNEEKGVAVSKGEVRITEYPTAIGNSIRESNAEKITKEEFIIAFDSAIEGIQQSIKASNNF